MPRVKKKTRNVCTEHYRTAAMALAGLIACSVEGIHLTQPSQVSTEDDPSLKELFAKFTDGSIEKGGPPIDKLEMALFENASSFTAHKNWWTSGHSVDICEEILQDPESQVPGVTSDAQKTHLLESDIEAVYLLDCEKDYEKSGFKPASLAHRLAKANLLDNDLLEKMTEEDYSRATVRELFQQGLSSS